MVSENELQIGSAYTYLNIRVCYLLTYAVLWPQDCTLHVRIVSRAKATAWNDILIAIVVSTFICRQIRDTFSSQGSEQRQRDQAYAGGHSEEYMIRPAGSSRYLFYYYYYCTTTTTTMAIKVKPWSTPVLIALYVRSRVFFQETFFWHHCNDKTNYGYEKKC